MYIAALLAVEAGGVEKLRTDVSPTGVQYVLSALKFVVREPGCEAKLRSLGPALAMLMENSLDYMPTFGLSTGAAAAQLSVGVFGRDEEGEEGSEMVFTEQHVEGMLGDWQERMRGTAYGLYASPSPGNMLALELTVSDARKPLLLSNPAFVTYLVDALLLDPEHPRAELEEQSKEWLQQMHCECLEQLALFAPGKEALLQDGSVVPALEAVAAGGMTEQARNSAAGALMALRKDDQPARHDSELPQGERHVMLSYNWAHQEVMKRVNTSLLGRGYSTWFE